ncbi:MAG TPA: hypothetical protein IAA01_10390, partial [Candidatus Fournierella excrementavium]|nr:hypothetical protein [Candidatus Fournierella excrementavium]
FAPFKKPGLLTGLFSYRSVIPPSPRETLLAQISPGALPPEGRPLQSSLCSGAFCFLQKTPSARSLAPPSPHKILLRKLSRGPAALAGGPWTSLHSKSPVF